MDDSPPDRGTPARVPPQPLVNAVPVQNVSGEAVSVTPVPGQTLVTMATATVTANNGQTVTIPVQGKEGGVGSRGVFLAFIRKIPAIWLE